MWILIIISIICVIPITALTVAMIIAKDAHKEYEDDKYY
jgi:NADH:ubiquinone oxidoreductase subunit 3 (subunit A)